MSNQPSSDNFELGVRYELGQGVEKDPYKAAKYYALAVDEGNPAAECALGEMYMGGNGVPKDHVKGIELFTRSASKGFSKSMFNMGMVFWAGAGVPQAGQADGKRLLRPSTRCV